MNFLDIRTVLFSAIISGFICVMVIFSLWRQNRTRLPELGFWLADFIMQFVAILMIALRGALPDFFSIVVANALVIGGALLLYIGLERYAGKTSQQRLNYIYLAIFILAHTYFAFVQPSLPARNINLSLGLLVVCSQCAWLLLHRVGSALRTETRLAGMIFIAYSLVSLVRVFVDLALPRENDLFKSGLYDVLAILIYQMLFIGLAFALSLMVNRRLFTELERDIAGCQQAQEEIQRLSRFPSENPNPVLRIERNGRILYANPSGAPILAAWGRDVGQEVPDDWQIQIASVFESGKNGEVEMDCQGQLFSCSLTPVLEEGYINLYGRDITEQKRAEEKLRYQAHLLERINDAIIASDAQFRLTAWNATAEALYGWKAGEVLGRIGLEILQTEWPAVDADEMRRSIAEQGHWRGEATQLRKDGSRFPVEISTMVLHDENGQITDYISIIRDITERKQAEAALRASEARYRALFDNMTEGFYQAEIIEDEQGQVADFRFMDVNPAYSKIIGLQPKEVLGKTASALFPNLEKSWLTAIRQVVQTQESLYLEGYVQATGRYYANSYFSPRPGQFASIFSDITERKQAEESQRQSELLFRTLFELSPDAVVILDPHDPKIPSSIVDCNAAACLMNGYQRDELIGQTIDIVNADPYSPGGQIAYLKKLREAGNLKLEVLHRHKSGVIFPVEVSTTLIKVGERELVIGIDRDITERKRAEELLRQNEVHLRLALNAAKAGTWEWNLLTNENIWSEELWKVYGLEAHSTKPSYDIWLATIHPDDREAAAQTVQEAAKNKTELNVEWRVVDPDGTQRWLMSRGQPIKNSAGLAERFIGIALDITERRQAEEELIASEVRYRRLFEAARDGILILEADTGQVVDVNPFLVEMLGFPRENFLGKELWELGFFKDIAANKINFLELQQNEYIRYQDLPLEMANGRKFHVEFVSNVYQVEHHKVVQCNIRDITERKRAEQTLRESEARFRSLFENMLNGFAYCQMLFDQGRPQDFIYLEVNRAFETLTGLKNVAGKKVTEIIPGIRESDPGLFEIYGRVALTGLPESFETYVEALEMWFFISVYSPQKEYFVAIFDVITERKRTEQEVQAYSEGLEARVMERTRELIEAQDKLVRQERLATLGQLAGSIGHELRNPLGVISNAIYYLKLAQPEASDKVREYLEIIEKETRTSDKIVTDLLDFTRIKSLNRQAASVSELVQQTLKRYPVPPLVQVTLEIPIDLPQIYADPQQVIQVLGNLIVNACQAMTSTSSTNGVSPPLLGQASSTNGDSVDGAKLTISAAVQGAMMIISVRDTGTGITPENMKKLFEPLFSTKNTGIGLGLAVSKKLAEANGGRIEVESQVGQGSTFILSLPVYLTPQV